jgi:hypothetical protein
MSRRLRVALLCPVALLAGCGGSSYVKLDVKKVQSVRLALAEGTDTICPTMGDLPEVVALVTYKDGKRLETRTPSNRDGKLRVREFEWTAEVGDVDENGVLLLPRDLLSWHDKAFSVEARIPARPDVKAGLQLTPRFDCAGSVSYRAINTPSSPPGKEGKPGAPALHLEVALAYVDTKLNGRLILVRVRDRELGRLGYYLLNPRSPERLTIVADGSNGGDGGPGRSGNDGAAGMPGNDGLPGGVCQNGLDGTPGGDGADGTEGTDGFRGGDGGNGPIVTLSYPAAFPELAQVLTFSVKGGAGGSGGRGGPGGRGGAGGAGGKGGSPGQASDPNADPSQACVTTRGNDGPTGNRGRDGASGLDAPAGRDGLPGTITARPGSAQEIFAFELARGWAIVDGR